jgi:hypothetical protein
VKRLDHLQRARIEKIHAIVLGGRKNNFNAGNASRERQCLEALRRPMRLIDE